MALRQMIEDDINLLYSELYDTKATFNGAEINVIYDSTYEVQSVREKVLRVQASDVVGITNSDTITIGNDDYRVISYLPTSDNLEMIIGVEL